jgi:hypothetical protein
MVWEKTEGDRNIEMMFSVRIGDADQIRWALNFETMFHGFVRWADIYHGAEGVSAPLLLAHYK